MEELILEIDLSQFAKRISSDDSKERIETIESIRDLSCKSIKAKEILSMLISALDTEQDPQIISRLTKLIGKLGDSTVLMLLKKYLWHPDMRVVANTLEGLGCIYSLDVIPIVLPFLNSSDNRVKANAARALYGLNPAMALDKLKEMTSSEEVFFRDSAAYILASIADPPCQELLIELIMAETDMEVLKKSISTLCNKGDELTIDKIKKINQQYGEHPKLKIFNEIIESIEQRLAAQRDNVQNINKINDLIKLTEIFNNGSNKEKEQVCLRLFDTGDEGALPLLKRAANDEDNAIRYAAKKAINNIFCKISQKNRAPLFNDPLKHPPGSQPAAVSKTRDSRPARPHAARPDALDFTDILEIIEKNPPVSPPTTATSSPAADAEGASNNSVRTLEEIDMAFLVLDLSNESAARRAEAVSKLLYATRDTKGVKEAVKYLVERLHVENEPQVKSQILRVIGTLGFKSEIAILKKYAEDETLDYRIRANALEGLGFIDSPEVFDIIVPFLKHSDNRIKANAVLAAWKRNSEFTFNAISDMIKSSNVAMRDSAAYCLLMLKSHDRKIINLMFELFIRETTTDIILKLTQGLSILGDENILQDMQKILPNASALKAPYIQTIIDKIKQKLDSLKNFNTQEAARENHHEQSDFDVEFERYVASRTDEAKHDRTDDEIDDEDNEDKNAYIAPLSSHTNHIKNTAPGERRVREQNYYEKSDGTRAPLKSAEAHLFEFNHPDEKVRLNAILAIQRHLATGLPQENFNQVEMMLTLSLNDASLRVRKEAFDAYQLIQTHRAVIIKNKKNQLDGD